MPHDQMVSHGRGGMYTDSFPKLDLPTIYAHSILGVANIGQDSNQ